MLRSRAPSSITSALLAISIGMSTASSGFAQDSRAQQQQQQQSLAAVMSTPAAVSHRKTGASNNTGSKAHYSRTALQAKARAAYPRTHFERGLYLKQKKDLNNALVEFLKATQENPHLVKGFYEQALIFRERGYRKLAESSLEQALADKPDYTDARILLATVRLEQGNFGGAVQELSRSLGLSMPGAGPDKTEVDKHISADKNNTDAPNKASGARDTGLLSMALPDILQSMHGIIGSPITPLANSDTAAAEANSEHTAQRKKLAALAEGESNLADSLADKAHAQKKYGSIDKKSKNDKSDDSAIATAMETATATVDSDKKTKPGKFRLKKGNALLSYFKRTIEPVQENNFKDKSATAVIENDLPTQMSIKPDDEKMPWETSASDVAKSSAKSETANEKTFWLETAKPIDAAPERTKEQVASAPDDNQNAPEGDKAQTSIFGSATTFNAPARPVSSTGILGSLFSSTPSATEALDADGKPVPPPRIVKLDTDEWAKKLKFYVDNGANSLKNGEAFMFSEDTGEASLFLADGTTIRRIVAQPVDARDVMRQRRPDIANAEDMLYGLSLLGKLIPKMDTQQPAALYEPAKQPPGSFRGDNLMSGSQTFWGWLKSVCKL